MRLGRDVLGLDLYQVLGVGQTATAREIRRAYLREVRASHPDLNPDDSEAEGRTAQLNVAARVLLDPALRTLYDRARQAPAEPKAAAWYERPRSSSRGRAGSEEWARPAAARKRRKPGPSAKKFLLELRSQASRLSLAVDERLEAMPTASRRTATLLLLGAAFWLIASARPRNLMADPGGAPPPTSVSPSVLHP
jgi:curved DNA-binding protein CbpA